MRYCEECKSSFEFESQFSFTIHLRKCHDITFKDYVLKYKYNGIQPVCGCGCGELVTWYGNDFAKLVGRHVTKEMREAQRLRRLGKKASMQARLKQSKASLEFFSTEEGRNIAQSRATKLNEFHASEAGEEWSRKQSERLKQFNSTEKGKKIRKKVGKELSELYKNDSIISKNMSNKLCSWWASNEGVNERKRRSLSLDTVNERLLPALKEFEFLENIDDVYTAFKQSSIMTRCRDCGLEVKRTFTSLAGVPRCLACKPFPSISIPQREIYDYVKSLGFCADMNDWKVFGNREIDVYVPSMKFGIEFNGLWWHSEINRTYFRHVSDKHILAREKNVRLFTIFEDEWTEKRSLVESMIKVRLGLAIKKDARKCSIRRLETEERKSFFNISHLDGDVFSEVAFGLFDNEKIVSAISLRKPFHNSLAQYNEIARFASAPGIIVRGALSKLIAKAILWSQLGNKKGLLSYVDMRVGDGHGYEKLGFKFQRETGPRFWWTDFKHRFNRFEFRAQNGMKQSEVAASAGVHKIWGAGNLVYVLEF